MNKQGTLLIYKYVSFESLVQIILSHLVLQYKKVDDSIWDD